MITAIQSSLEKVVSGSLPGPQISASTLSRQLREDGKGYLPYRRVVVGASLVATAAMGMISLYQIGILKHLPEPPLPLLNADRVDASAEAYSRYESPDGALGLNSYGTTLLLAAMGGRDRAQTHPWLPLALAAKATFDLAQAIRLTRDQWTKYRTFCFGCLMAVGSTVIAWPLVLPEAWSALRNLITG